jgi:translocator protein
MLCAFLLFALLLLLEWDTVFLSPTELDIAFYYYCLIIVISLTTALIFMRFDKFAGYSFIPYILWNIFMATVFYELYLDNNDGKWFYNADVSVTNAESTTNVTQHP